MRVAITGLPLSGKTSIFSALTRSRSSSEAGARTPAIGIARIDDERLAVLARMFNPKKVVGAEIELLDMPGAPIGQKAGLFSGETTTHFQKADALMLVVRAFDDPAVPHPAGSLDLRRDLDQLIFDVTFADIALIDRRIERLHEGAKGVKAAQRADLDRRIETLRGLQQGLEQGAPIRAMTPTETVARELQDIFTLSSLPLVIAVNVGEEQILAAASIESEARDAASGPRIAVAAVCGRLEAELATLSGDDETEMRAALNAGKPAADVLARLALDATGLVTFFTVGSDEVRAWTVPDGSPAPKAARRVHTDIERGFIRAEVVSYDDLVRSGGTPQARSAGLLRQEGRTYAVRDGDVIDFLFSV